MDKTVRTRFAPSPTGDLHIGGVRTALYCYLHARHCAGEFVLRVEDTDRQRSSSKSVDAIVDAMDWLGLTADSGPFFQTDRLDRYQQASEQLLASGDAYYCYCSAAELDAMREAQRQRGEKPRYDRRHRDSQLQPPEDVKPVVRFKTPLTGQVRFNDLIRGEVVVENAELDDLVIVRSDGLPTYNFAVVVDDMDMQISHVIRGDDHINNTPRQINIFNALGAQVPEFAHVPMILGPDGQRLSKRHGAVSVLDYRKAGYLPEAVLNYLVRLGWSHGDQEIFSLDEMIGYFDVRNVNLAPSAINPEKLNWLNQHYLKHCDNQRLARLYQQHTAESAIVISDDDYLVAVVNAYKERAKTVADLVAQSVFLFGPLPELDAKAANKHLRLSAAQPLADVAQRLNTIPKWESGQISQQINQVVDSHDIAFAKLGQPLRVAVTGGRPSPGIDVTLELMGRDKSLAGIDRALAYISARQASNG